MQILIPQKSLIWYKIQGTSSILQVVCILCILVCGVLFLEGTFQIFQLTGKIPPKYLEPQFIEYVFNASFWFIVLFFFLGLTKKAFVHTVILPEVTKKIIQKLKYDVLFWNNHNYNIGAKESLSSEYQSYADVISKAFSGANISPEIVQKLKELQSIKSDNIIIKSLQGFTKGPNLSFIAKKEAVSFLVYKIRSQNNKYTKNILAIQDEKIKCKFDFIITKKTFFNTYKNKVKTEIEALKNFVIYSDVPTENITQEVQNIGLKKIQKFLEQGKENKIVSFGGRCYFLRYTSNNFKVWKIQIPKPNGSQYQVQNGMVFTTPEFDQEIPKTSAKVEHLFDETLDFLKY